MKTFRRFIVDAYSVSEISKQQVQEFAFLAPLIGGLLRGAGVAAARGAGAAAARGAGGAAARGAGGAAARGAGGAAARKGLGGELKDLAIQSVKDKMLDRFTNGQQPPESAESEEDMVEPTDGEGTALSKLLKIK
jgi:hypothetical protein